MKNTKGFTIIEVLFVLAIAGVIMLLVFLAIPQLQRNSRNNQRKQDVGAILEAVSHWELNNSGAIPQSSDNYLQFTKLTFYDKTTGIVINSYSDANSSPTSVSGSTDPDKVTIYNYQKCDSATRGASTRNGAGFNDVVALFAIETASGVNSQCQEL